MSAVPPRTDILWPSRHVRKVPDSDLRERNRDVRFTSTYDILSSIAHARLPAGWVTHRREGCTCRVAAEEKRRANHATPRRQWRLVTLLALPAFLAVRYRNLARRVACLDAATHFSLASLVYASLDVAIDGGQRGGALRQPITRKRSARTET